MDFKDILQTVLQVQPQTLAGIFCDEEGEMVAMTMQPEARLDPFELKVRAASAAVWVQRLTRVQSSANDALPDMSLRFARYQVVIKALPRDYYLLFLARRRVPVAQLRMLLRRAARACAAEM